MLYGVCERGDGPLLERAVDAKRGAGHPARLRRAELIRIEQGQHPVRGRHGRIGSLGHAFQEEEEPRLPVAALAHLVQERVVIRPALLEEEAQVQHRLAQRALAPEQERDEQPPDAPVPVQKRVDGLELHVRETRAEQGREFQVLPVPEALQIRHALADPMRRRRHEVRRGRPAPADPVLGAPELARALARAAAPREQPAVDLADKPRRERETIPPHPRQAVFERRHVVRDLDHVVNRRARRPLHLEHEQVGERGLRPLDLGGEHGLLPHVGVEEDVGVGQQRGQGVEAAQRERRPLQRRVQGCQIERRPGRQTHRHECAHGLAAERRRLVCARLCASHGEPLYEAL